MCIKEIQLQFSVRLLQTASQQATRGFDIDFANDGKYWARIDEKAIRVDLPYADESILFQWPTHWFVKRWSEWTIEFPLR